MTLRFVPTSLTLCLGIASAAGQDRVRLDEQVRAPLAYMQLAGGAEGRNALASLQNDPAARMLWSSVVDESTSNALGQFDALGELGTGEVEVSLNALLPRADAPALPLMVCRVELGAERANELKKSLDGGSLAQSAPAIAGRETWEFGRDDVGGARRLLVAIVGEDLLASNSEAMLGDVLRRVPAGGTSTPHPDSVFANRTFAAQRELLGRDLRERTAARSATNTSSTPRGHVLHLDWKRVRERWVERMTPAQEIALTALGALTADHVTIAVKADDARDATRVTVLLDQPNGPAGLLAAAAPAAPRKVIGALPPVSLAGMTISLDAARLGGLFARRFENTGSDFARDLDDRCATFGLDFAEQVLPRLSGFGSAQLVLLDDEASEQGVAFAIGTKSAASARALLTELRASILEHGAAPRRGGGSPPQERGGRAHPPRPHAQIVQDERDLITVEGPFGSMSFGAVGDDFVIAARRGTIERMSRLLRTRAREHAKVRARTIELCESIVAARPAGSREAIGVVEIDGSTLGLPADASLGRHAGLLFLDDGNLRIELSSPH
ncbi:MAG: hypothetical protein AB7I19_18370 [Planctomycetota bacterium]